jgi:hypothetical protein
MAFFIGPFSVGLTRWVVANWWLFRGARILGSAAGVLALAAIGELRAAPSSLAATDGAAVGAVVVALAALLAVLGVQMTGSGVRTASVRTFGERSRAIAFPMVAGVLTGGGSINTGMLLRRTRPEHSLVIRSGRVGRLLIGAVLAAIVFATVAAVSGSAVLTELITPAAARQILPWNTPFLAWNAAPPVTTIHRVRHVRIAPSPWPAPSASSAPTTPSAASSPPPGSAAVESRRDGISGATGITGSTGVTQVVAPSTMVATGAPISENELTFAKGYEKRRAAQEAKKIKVALATDLVSVGIKLPTSREVSIQIAPERRSHRRVAYDKRRSYRDDRGKAREMTEDRRPGRYRHTTDDRYGDRADARHHVRADNRFAPTQPYDRMAHF